MNAKKSIIKAVAHLVKGEHHAVFLMLSHDPSLANEIYVGDLCNQTLLQLAILYNDPLGVKLLLNAGANPNLLVDEEYYWEDCILLKCHSILVMLLESGLDPNQLSPSGLRPLDCSALYGDLIISSVLVGYGAHINGVSQPPYDSNETTPLCAAVRFRRARIVRWLLAHGADPEIREIRTGKNPIELAPRFGRIRRDIKHVLRRKRGL